MSSVIKEGTVINEGPSGTLGELFQRRNHGTGAETAGSPGMNSPVGSEPSAHPSTGLQSIVSPPENTHSHFRAQESFPLLSVSYNFQISKTAQGPEGLRL